MTDTGRPDYLVPLKPGEELIFEKIGTDMDKLREKIEEAIAGKTQTCNGITMTFSTPEETLVELLKQARDALPVWVPVEDGLPEEWFVVLVYDGVFVSKARLCHGVWDEECLPPMSDITHWMPLPTPPEP